MIRFWKIVGVGAAAVIVFDGIASYASIFFSFPYPYSSIGSILIYTIVGFTACRDCSFWEGIIAAAIMGVVDSTIGWFVSWKIGPGAIPGVEMTPTIILGTMIFVVCTASGSGLLGAGTAKFMAARK